MTMMSSITKELSSLITLGREEAGEGSDIAWAKKSNLYFNKKFFFSYLWTKKKKKKKEYLNKEECLQTLAIVIFSEL